ncbi:MAG: leucine--tRNA ligase [bacterium]
MNNYEPDKIESKWQKFWEEQGLNKAEDFGNKAKFYCLDMFPYPSGAGLHVGHPKGYTATDIISRYKRMSGFNVLHPIGWDAFGLPAENYAIKTKVHPNESTHKNIAYFKEQIKSLGFSYDWEREIDTSSPEYYKWTQWFFLFLYKNGWAYKAKASVNWCDSCQTVLANEQAQDGKCERCSSEVSQKDLEQWFFKITDFNEELLAGLDKIDWPEPIKIMQKNWIGKSTGHEIRFKIHDSRFEINVFTTRIDTIFGCTYLVVAPEHEIILNLKSKILNLKEVKEYVEVAKKKSERDRQADVRDKTGVKLEGIMAINPANGKEIPIFVADYVLSGYGTGAIMAVPAHDARDFEFAKKYGLPCPKVILPPELSATLVNAVDFAMGKKDCVRLEAECWEEEGILTNSEQFNGIASNEAIESIGQWLASKKIAEKKVNYRMRDWLVSRQRYWGAPIPIIYCDKCGEQAVLEKDLPVLLPTDVDFVPTGESPLTKSKDFHNVKCPQCGGQAKRESDTMDTFVCSSWYFFRYLDYQNKNEFAGLEKIKYWLPVDLYVGGAEHAVLHLLYARFFTKALFRKGLISFDEPFLKLRNVGLILAEGGVKMSKSKGNVINPDDIVKEYGADTLRIYEMFMGPFDQAIAWNTEAIIGARKFLERIWLLVNDSLSKEFPKEIKFRELKVSLELRIKKVSEDIEQMKFNTAISCLMGFIGLWWTQKDLQEGFLSKKDLERFLIIVSPFAPHIAEELWHRLGNNDSIFLEQWSKPEEEWLFEDRVKIVVQINGKARGVVEVEAEASQGQALEIAKQDEKINKWLKGQTIKKVVFVQNKLINFVVDFQ